MPNEEQRCPLLLQSLSANEDYYGMVMDHQDRHLRYCAMHGYAYSAQEAPNVPWFRLCLVLDAIKTGTYSHVFWVDADCFVADLSRDMRETLPDWAWLGMTIHPYPWIGQPFHLQSGMFYFRSCPESVAFLERVLALHSEFRDDQAAINRMMIGSMESAQWQKGLNILSKEWNNTLHDQVNDPIVAAFHGYLEPAQRRAHMLEVAKRYPFHVQASPPQKITLNMIERNEEAVLPRSLHSFLKLQNYGYDLGICIGEGGSTDRSWDVIKKVAEGIQGTVFQDPQSNPIDDFSLHRNHVIERSPNDGYLFLIDADDKLVIEPTFNPYPPLTDDAYEVKLICDGKEWYRTVLVKAGLPWRYVGARHEAITLDGEKYPVTKLMGMHILVHAGEGARSREDKAAQDVEILKEELEADPDNSRTVFYLAQSQRDAGMLQDSLVRYSQRANMTGEDEEEVYISRLEIGRLMLRLDYGIEDITDAFLAAYNTRPQRAESLFVLAHYMLEMDQPESAMTYSMLAASLPVPNDRLFVDREIYEWKAWDLFVAAAYKAGHYQAAQDACIELLLNPSVPEAQRDHIRTNLRLSNAGRWK
jgi:hypothetical protein